MKVTSPILLSGIAALALLSGCSKPAAPAPEPAASRTEDGEIRTPQEIVQPAAKPQKSTAEQAATLLQFIEDRPECEGFRAPLEQVSAAPAGQTVELNMAEIMDQAYKAGCQKGPG